MNGQGRMVGVGNVFLSSGPQTCLGTSDWSLVNCNMVLEPVYCLPQAKYLSPALPRQTTASHI